MAADAPEVREAEQDGLLAVNAGGDYGAGDVRLIDQPSECGRKMEASPQAHGMYYRRPARTLASGSPALASHPPAVYLREDPIREAVNSWIGRLFDRTNVDRTVTALVASQDGAAERGGYEAAKKRLADAEARLRRFQAAIASGVDPAALVDVIDDAQAQRAAARRAGRRPGAESAHRCRGVRHDRLDGRRRSGLSDAKEESLADLYAAIDLQVRYEPGANAADVGIRLGRRVNSAGVRGGSCALTTRLVLP